MHRKTRTIDLSSVAEGHKPSGRAPNISPFNTRQSRQDPLKWKSLIAFTQFGQVIAGSGNLPERTCPAITVIRDIFAVQWPIPATLQEAINLAVLEKNRLVPVDGNQSPFLSGGYSDAEVGARSKELGKPIPEPIVEMYRAVRGIVPGPDYSGMFDITLVDLQHCRWVDPDQDSTLCEIEGEHWRGTLGTQHFSDAVTK